MKTGRPLLFETPEELEAAINKYFDDCDKGEKQPVVDKKGNPVVGDDGKVVMAKTPTAYTMEGLALALDCDRRTITNYANRDAFFPVITRARQRIYRDWIAGGLSGRYNAKIAALCLAVHGGYNVKQQHEVAVKTVEERLREIEGHETQAQIGEAVVVGSLPEE